VLDEEKDEGDEAIQPAIQLRCDVEETGRP
jgi:hypothetical protein